MKASAIKSTGVNDILYNFGPQNNPNYSVTFLSDKSFRLNLYENYSYTKNDSSFFFRKDSSIGPFDYYVSLISPFILYPEMKPDNNGNYIYRKELIGDGSYSALNIDQLDICLLFKDSLTGNFISKYSRRSISNKFNPEGLKTLGRRDTVAVIEFRTEYR